MIERLYNYDDDVYMQSNEFDRDAGSFIVTRECEYIALFD